MNDVIKALLCALEKNNMRAIYAEKAEQIPDLVSEMLFDGCVITAGGSMSLKECGVWDLISQKRYCFIDRSREGITPEEKQEAFRAAIGCDFFLCSCNAVTQNGELVNVDGYGNRVSSIAFGPKKVIAVVGCNKIVKDLQEGFLRIKQIAAPKNCVRLNIDTPCSKLGHCVSLLDSNCPDITHGCNHPRRICADYVVNGRQIEKDRITVIICGEELGY